MPNATESQFIEAQIAAGNFAPAARTADLSRTIEQYNEANALDPSDADYMVHPGFRQ